MNRLEGNNINNESFVHTLLSSKYWIILETTISIVGENIKKINNLFDSSILWIYIFLNFIDKIKFKNIS